MQVHYLRNLLMPCIVQTSNANICTYDLTAVHGRIFGSMQRLIAVECHGQISTDSPLGNLAGIGDNTAGADADFGAMDKSFSVAMPPVSDAELLSASLALPEGASLTSGYQWRQDGEGAVTGVSCTVLLDGYDYDYGAEYASQPLPAPDGTLPAAVGAAVGVEGQVEVVVPCIALTDGAGRRHLRRVAAEADGVGGKVRLHGVGDEVHKVLLAAGAGDVRVVFLCAGT